MNALRRLLLAIFSLVIIVLGSAIVVFSFDHALSKLFLDNLQQLISSVALPLLLLVALLVLALGGCGLYVAFVYKSKPSYAPLSLGDGGQVNISMAAIDDVVHKTIATIDEIADLKSKISLLEQGILIELSLILSDDVKVPDLATKAQAMVKTRVEDVTGLSVNQVKIIIISDKAAAKSAKSSHGSKPGNQASQINQSSTTNQDKQITIKQASNSASTPTSDNNKAL